MFELISWYIFAAMEKSEHYFLHRHNIKETKGKLKKVL